MVNKKNHNKNVENEGEDMSAILEQKHFGLKEKLDRLSKKASTLNSKNGMIELDPENTKHKEWFEIDQYKGK